MWTTDTFPLKRGRRHKHESMSSPNTERSWFLRITSLKGGGRPTSGLGRRYSRLVLWVLERFCLSLCLFEMKSHCVALASPGLERNLEDPFASALECRASATLVPVPCFSGCSCIFRSLHSDSGHWESRTRRPCEQRASLHYGLSRCKHTPVFVGEDEAWVVLLLPFLLSLWLWCLHIPFTSLCSTCVSNPA